MIVRAINAASRSDTVGVRVASTAPGPCMMILSKYLRYILAGNGPARRSSLLRLFSSHDVVIKRTSHILTSGLEITSVLGLGEWLIRRLVEGSRLFHGRLVQALRNGEMIHTHVALNCVVLLKPAIRRLHQTLGVDLSEVQVFLCLKLIS